MDLWSDLEPLDGGYSGETFVAQAAGEPVVVRIYAGRSRSRGPGAPETDAALLGLVHGVLPVPEVLEVRRPAGEMPGLLVTSLLPGVRLDAALPHLDAAAHARLAEELGVLLGRLAHMVQPRPGSFATPDLVVEPFPPEAVDLPVWLQAHAGRLIGALGVDAVDRLGILAEDAQALLDQNDRVCLVHGDFNLKNLLVEPATGHVTGLIDWEFAHAGAPHADLGNLFRFDHHTWGARRVIDAYRDFLPPGLVPDDVLARARAADLFALIDLAARESVTPVVEEARRLLAAR